MPNMPTNLPTYIYSAPTPSSGSSVMRLDAEVNAKQRLQFKTVD